MILLANMQEQLTYQHNNNVKILTNKENFHKQIETQISQCMKTKLLI